MQNDNWYYETLGMEMGPASIETLIELARNQTISADDRVKLGVDGKWRRAGSIGRIMAVLPYQAEARQPVLTVTPARAIAAVTITPSPAVARAAGMPESAAPAPVRKRAPVAKRPIAPATPANSPEPVVAASPAPKVSNPTPELSNEVLIQRVREALDSRNIASFYRLEVQANQGVITLLGNVASEGERLLALRLAEKTSGVVRIVNSLTIIGRPAPIIPQSAVSATPPRSITPPAFTPPIAARVPARPRPMTSRGPGPLSQLLESIKTEYRNQAIALVATIGLLGFLFYPRGPVRPVTVHPVKGKIILDGKPLANAAVVLHRVGSSKIPANLHPRAKASADGTFQLETFDPADGAPNGEFVATVFLTEEKEIDGEKQAGPNLLPTVYSQPETSPLKLNITSATSELQPLELTRG